MIYLSKYLGPLPSRLSSHITLALSIHIYLSTYLISIIYLSVYLSILIYVWYVYGVYGVYIFIYAYIYIYIYIFEDFFFQLYHIFSSQEYDRWWWCKIILKESKSYWLYLTEDIFDWESISLNFPYFY